VVKTYMRKKRTQQCLQPRRVKCITPNPMISTSVEPSTQVVTPTTSIAPGPSSTLHHQTSGLTSVNQEDLLPPSEVIAKYPKLRGDSKMGELATNLARESFFWQRAYETEYGDGI